MRKKVAVIILNWNGKKWLGDCISSILRQNADSPFEVFLVDNGSNDDSVIYVRNRFLDVKVVELGKNYGFAEGNNRALKYVDSDYLVFVNNDVKAEERWLKKLINAADENPEYEILCSIQLPSQRENRIRTLNFFGNVIPSPHESSHSITDSIFASGGCFLIRRNWLEKIGYLFDPYYFYLAEDVELSLRTILSGGHIGYIRDSKIYHFEGGTAFPSFWWTFLSTRNLLLTYYKTFTLNAFNRILIVRGVFFTAYIAFRFMICPWKWRNRIEALSGTVGGMLSFFHDYGRYKDFRREFLSSRKREEVYIFKRLVVTGRLQKLLKRVLFGV